MKKTALVLGAGAYTGGAFETGALAALSEFGWDARTSDVIVGTSIGSFVGYMLRCGFDPRVMYRFTIGEDIPSPIRSSFDQLSDTADVPTRGTRKRRSLPPPSLLLRAIRNPWRSRAALLTAALPVGRYELDGLAHGLRKICADPWPTGELWTVAARLPHCERTVFASEGCPSDAATAIAASCAVPGIFTPIEIGGETYVDGGVHSPTNADLIADGGFDRAIVISPMSMRKTAVRGRAVDGVRLYFRALLAREVKALRRRGIDVMVIQPGNDEIKAMGLNAFDEERAPRVAKAAYEATSRILERKHGWTVEPLAA
jgi:NTE family protein